MLVARSIGAGRVNVVGLRLPEDESPDSAPLTKRALLRKRLAGIWKFLAGG